MSYDDDGRQPPTEVAASASPGRGMSQRAVVAWRSRSRQRLESPTNSRSRRSCVDDVRLVAGFRCT